MTAGGETKGQLEYRPHIDGLRAIAVASVVLFHLGVPGIRGGYVGVDIFFVISGFLISRIIFAELSQGRFSLVQFFLRRGRRILPALYATVAATAVAAWFVMFPVEMKGFAESALASILFSANVYFYFTLDYFATATKLPPPLLHIWSLGVEEQFYFVFPFVLMLAHRFRARASFLLLLALAIGSLAASQVMLRLDPQASFYLLPFRAFELLIGTLIAHPACPRVASATLGRAMPVLGLAAIAAAVALFDKATSFPGVAALLPSLGTGLVIWSLESHRGVLAQLLSQRPLLHLGHISYSLYLVHWPVIVFAQRLFPHAGWGARAAVCLLASLVLAWASYVLIETPTRRARLGLALFSRSVAAGTVLALGAGYLIAEKGSPSRLGQEIAAMQAYLAYDPNPYFLTGTCFLRPEQRPQDVDLDACLPRPDTKPSIVLWGDSLSAQYHWGLKPKFQAAGVGFGVITASGCAPLLGIDNPQRPNCRAFNDAALQAILNARPSMVVLGATWFLSEEMLQPLNRTIDALNAAGIKVVVQGDGALYKRAVPLILADRWSKGNFSPFADDEIEALWVSTSNRITRKMFGGRADVTYISVIDTVCPTLQCPLQVGDKPAYFDATHLTLWGSEFFADRLFPMLMAALPGKR